MVLTISWSIMRFNPYSINHKMKIMNWIKQKTKKVITHIPRMSGGIGYFIGYYFEIPLKTTFTFIFFVGFYCFLIDCFNKKTKNMHYLDYLKLYINNSAWTSSAIIIVYCIIYYLESIQPILISIGTVTHVCINYVFCFFVALVS